MNSFVQSGTTDNLSLMLIIAGVVVVAILAIGLIFAKLYKRATKETAFVRTGLGGEKVVKDGGAVVLPVLHEVMPVNMTTLRIEVVRDLKSALITKDRMRVDVRAEFYLRVAPTTEGISMAAQTLGYRTMDSDQVKELMEGKFVDVLRAVAAEMTMTEMHEQRADFVQRVQNNVATDLEKNGLELESVSLTGFDQTNLEYFDENNAFDAEGRARLTRIIQEKRKETNDIEQQTRILIETRNLEADKQALEISKAKEQASLEQQRELEFSRAEQKMLIAQQAAEKARESEVAEINKDRAIQQARIEKEQVIEQREIERKKAIEASKIEQEQTIREKQIEQQRAVEVAEQIKQVAVAVKSKEESVARADAAAEERKKVEAEEAVITARELAEANRKKQIEVLEASQEAEREAVAVKVAAEAEQAASKARAEAVVTEAEASAKAERIRAEAKAKSYEVEAEGKRMLNEADNVLSLEQIELQKAIQILKVLPEIIAQTVKPLEQIDSIKILQGYNGLGSSAGVGEAAGSEAGLSEQITNAALKYRANAPMVDAMLSELGLVKQGEGLEQLLSGSAALTQNAIHSKAVNGKAVTARAAKSNGAAPAADVE
ncbi:flotillin family protein [Shewanella avicenniae]|uniref:Flotillin family protein n=1 Tax=Shewanella avicenniae TaxID=2814294 RepID=A0ABX7QQM3_9GAMM|nr:flotillin domain-containing protein [Shewanella avicenniae]QSX33768.1 flotillin family protein [Shewanella avicenniae]